MAADCDLIDALESQWRDALLSRDIDRLRTLIHPRFVLIGSRSTGPFTINREEWLAAVQQRQIVSIALDIREAVVFEDVMIGTIDARWKVKYLGGEIEDCVLLTDVWVRDEDRWQVVRRHSSPAPPDGSKK
ncbi:MAG TPA: nuclear transport factor 2 family protein [Sphingomicrobium sp.]